jgi:glycosyltransferase involved in cell wall biosynthesis
MLSVALVTRNRARSLERALESWRRQDVQPGEIVISDDSSPETAPEIEALARRFGCRYVPGPRRGLYANRNHAAAHCRGSHILSADDDHEHPAGFVRRVVEAVTGEPRTVWAIGEFHSWADFEASARFQPPGQLSAHGSLHPVARDATDCWSVADGATAYPREVFDSGLRFYEGVRFGASYSEFGCAMRRAGWRIRPLWSTAVVHHVREAPRSIVDPVGERAAWLFALLMFSFFYQPSAAHKLIAASKLPLTFVQHPLHARAIIRLAFAHVRARRADLTSAGSEWSR